MPSNRPGILALAIALAAGAQATNAQQAQAQMAQANAIRYSLDNAYRRAGKGKRTNAAQQQRAAKKLRRIRARASKRV